MRRGIKKVKYMGNIGKFFNTEYKTTAVDRIKQIGEQAAEGARESAPVILGTESYIDKQGLTLNIKRH